LYSPVFNVVGPGDSYLYTTANDLVLGTSTTGTADVVIFTGGSLSGTSTFGGNERMRITNAGNVGIGTATPNTNLTVVGNISATGNVYGNTATMVLPASTTTYQLVPSDSGITIASLNNTTGLTATIAGAYPSGFQVALIQLSGGRINVNGGTNINQANGYFKTNKQYSAATLVNVGVNGWVLFGDVGV
jgi:hypothetical protein